MNPEKSNRPVANAELRKAWENHANVTPYHPHQRSPNDPFFRGRVAEGTPEVSRV